MKFHFIRGVWQEGIEKIFRPAKHVRLILPRAALNAIFDECDRFDRDETGGRIIGTFSDSRGNLTLKVTGIIESGPKAQRSAVSFFQDGEYQEQVFREIERDHPDIEHLGNWHTHHCNGLSTLSGGDLATYRRIVNHHNHNTDFFYALLVVAKQEATDLDQRYSVKHYIFHRGNERVYEIPERFVEVVDTPLVWPLDMAHHRRKEKRPIILEAPHHGKAEKRDSIDTLGAKQQRAFDRDILAESYQEIRPFTSNKLGFYWRGPIELSDGSKAEVVVLEELSAGALSYSIVLREPPDVFKILTEQFAKREFQSASSALITMERNCNRVLFEQRERSRETSQLKK